MCSISKIPVLLFRGPTKNIMTIRPFTPKFFKAIELKNKHLTKICTVYSH